MVVSGLLLSSLVVLTEVAEIERKQHVDYACVCVLVHVVYVCVSVHLCSSPCKPVSNQLLNEEGNTLHCISISKRQSMGIKKLLECSNLRNISIASSMVHNLLETDETNIPTACHTHLKSFHSLNNHLVSM